MREVPARLLVRGLLFKLSVMVAVVVVAAVFSAKADIVETVSYVALTNRGIARAARRVPELFRSSAAA